MRDFRVLLVYVNSMMDNLIPLNISCLTACLKQKGIDVRLFDTTFHKTADKSTDEARVEMLQVKPFDLSEYGINYKPTDVLQDFRELIVEYKPNLIGFSVVESTYPLAVSLLNSIANVKGNCKVIFGGIFSIFAFNKIINNPLVDMVCHGEGEKTITEVCENTYNNTSLKKIDNLIVKEDGDIVLNKKAPLVDINELPYLDFSLFEKERFYKPMGGRVLRMVPVEFARGCPFKCTYCASPALAEQFKGSGKWFRKKNVKRIISEIEYYLKKYDAEYFYFISDSFLSLREDEFKEFCDSYKSIRIPFWFNTRLETISADKLEKLESINCDRISIGLESGSEHVRKKLLKRHYSNDYFVEKFKTFNDFNISVSINNIIGFPDETREQIFETVNLNRQIKAESFGAYIFQPYHGTALRDYCIERGYIDEFFLAGDAHFETGLNMPQLTLEEIKGLQRTFSLYVKLPPKYYNDIKIAEKYDEEGNRMFQQLTKVYYERCS